MLITLLIIYGVVLTGIAISLGVAIYKGLEREKIYTNWILKFRTRVEDIYRELKEIDDREIFQKDDEVGIAFSEIVSIMKEFDEEVK